MAWAYFLIIEKHKTKEWPVEDDHDDHHDYDNHVNLNEDRRTTLSVRYLFLKCNNISIFIFSKKFDE